MVFDAVSKIGKTPVTIIADITPFASPMNASVIYVLKSREFSRPIPIKYAILANPTRNPAVMI